MTKHPNSLLTTSQLPQSKTPHNFHKIIIKKIKPLAKSPPSAITFHTLMSKSIPNFDNINPLKQAYDAINSSTSSYHQSLLVSPYCSKFDKISNSNNQLQSHNYDSDQYFINYIHHPLNTQKFNKTQMKYKSKSRHQMYEDHHHHISNSQSFLYSFSNQQNNRESCILSLQTQIKEKDQRIQTLEKNIAKLTQQTTTLPTQNTQSPPISKQFTSITISRKTNQTLKQPQKSKQLHQPSSPPLILPTLQIQNYKKQIKFLIHNNQELYQQLQKITEYSTHIKTTLSSTLHYTSQLQYKYQQIYKQNLHLQSLNSQLLQQKQQMMKNYQQQFTLFQKMKKVWESTQHLPTQQSSSKLKHKKQKQKYLQTQRKSHQIPKLYLNQS